MGHARLPELHDKVVSLESKVFAAADERLLWAGETKSFNPESAASVASELADLVVRDMAKSGLLGAGR